jgi:hypothetical protein
MDLNNSSFRVTWRLPKDTQLTLKKITDKTAFSQEEVGNLMLRYAIENFDDLKPTLEKFAREKDAIKRKSKKVESAMSKLSPEAMERFSNSSPEAIEKMLKLMESE